MKPDLERLLKAMDAFRQAPNTHEDARLRTLYEAELEAAAQKLKLDKETLDRMIHPLLSALGSCESAARFPQALGT